MNEIIESFLGYETLDLYLKIALPFGYMGYLIATMGTRKHDKTSDILFGTLIFATISAMTFLIVDKYHDELWAIAMAIFTPLAIAFLWRRYICDAVLNYANRKGITNSTQYPDVWTEIISNQNVGVTQIIVNKKNGDSLQSHFVYDYKDSPIDCMRWDHGGNIAIYVSKIKKKGEEKFRPVKSDVIVEQEDKTSYRLTYIPKEEIESVKVTFNKPKR